MDAVQATALQQAADDRLITQEQADWVLGRHGGQNGQGKGMNSDQNNSAVGRMGRGASNNGGQPGDDCLYQVP